MTDVRQYRILGAIDKLLEDEGSSSNEDLQDKIGLDIRCKITTDKDNKSYLRVEVGGVKFEFAPEYLNGAFELYPNLCKYFERRKKKREFQEFTENVA